jgi:hypothetical protein
MNLYTSHFWIFLAKLVVYEMDKESPYFFGSRRFIINPIILFNSIVQTLLSLVSGPLSGNECGSPSHIYVISLLLVALLTQFIPDN